MRRFFVYGTQRTEETAVRRMPTPDGDLLCTFALLARNRKSACI